MLENYVALNKSRAVADSATIAPLPEYEEYQTEDPLRASIKLLKRHRDEWAIRTKNERSRPISAVITTLAAHAWLNVAMQSRQRPFTPLEAILEIVRTMPNFIRSNGQEYMVCNPEDSGENFAEKWNRPGEGSAYQRAFYEWHESACKAFSLGLESYSSVESFAKAVNESFGIGRSFVDEVNTSIPANWTMPGRPSGMNRNSVSMGALFGGVAGSDQSQADTKPVGRLG